MRVLQCPNVVSCPDILQTHRQTFSHVYTCTITHKYMELDPHTALYYTFIYIIQS